MDGDASFGAWVRRRRRELDLTQAELARQVSCAEVTVRMIEADARRPSRELADRLAEPLQVAPADRAAFAASARGDRRVAALGQPAPPPAPPSVPVPATPLVGREREVTAVRQRLAGAATRLLTLTGPGGVGKTRLALRVAAELLADGAFADGVAVVALEAVRDPGLVRATIARAVGVAEAAGQPLGERLLAELRGKRRLLVLDNFEQVVAAAPLLAELLAAAPGLKILVTSRVVLHLAAEHEFPVPPLRTADPARLPHLDALARVESVALFVQRAEAVAPNFALTEANAAAIAAICARLDGLPLALELAAARIKLFEPGALLPRLARRLELLTGGARDLPARQQTLRAALDWSHDLLTAPEQALLHRLAVFVGGCTVEAAEAVCEGEHGQGGEAPRPSALSPLPLRSILDGLAALVDQSMLHVGRGPDGEPRFRPLETVREYGLERLEVSGEAAVARRRHAAYFLALAEAAEPALRGPEQTAWLARLEMEHDNLRAALRWSLSEGGADAAAAGAERAEAGLRLASALSWFWYVHGHHGEGRSWLTAALAAGDGAALRLRAKALIDLGMLGLPHGVSDARATALLEEGLALLRGLGDGPRVAWALCELGSVAHFRGDYGRAGEVLGEGLALFRGLGDKRGVARTLEELGVVARFRGDYRWAAALLEEGLALMRELGDTWGVARTLHQLGIVTRNRGDAERATRLLGESLALFRELGDAGGVAWALRELGITARQRGDHARATPLLEESLALFRDVGDPLGTGRVLEELGVAARFRGDYVQAARLLEEGLSLLRGLGDKRGIALTLHDLGVVERCRGDDRRATALLAEALALCRDLGDKRGIAVALEEVATVARGRPARAARLLGAAAALRAGIGAPLAPVERLAHEQTLARLRAELGEAGFAAAWAAGQALPADEAAAEALADPPSGAAAAVAPGPAPPAPHDATVPLTPREREVALRLARGRTNREIARELGLAPRMVDAHVRVVLAKLGLAGRADIARWVAQVLVAAAEDQFDDLPITQSRGEIEAPRSRDRHA